MPTNNSAFLTRAEYEHVIITDRDGKQSVHGESTVELFASPIVAKITTELGEVYFYFAPTSVGGVTKPSKRIEI